MAQSVKLSDGSYIDASGVYDTTQGKTQAEVNSAQAEVNAKMQRIKHTAEAVTTNSSGEAVLTGIDGSTKKFLLGSGNGGQPCLYRYGRTVVVYSAFTLQPVKSTSLTITYYYVENYN